MVINSPKPACWPFEHFIPMPSQKIPRRQVFAALGFDERIAMLRQQGVLGGFAARYLLAEHQREAVGQDGESAQVENLVM